jgi:hypothetical protein
MEWLQKLFTFKPRFEVGDVIRAKDSEEWESDEYTVTKVGENKYQYSADGVNHTYYIDHIDSAYYKVNM